MNSKIHGICHRLAYSALAVVILFFHINWISPVINYKDSNSFFDPSTAAVFPKSLQSIGEESFSETTLQYIVFENKMASIGEKAFYKTSALKAVYIPSSVLFIANDAFQKSSLKVVYGIYSSTAHKWAKEKGLLFVPKDIWYTYKGIGCSHNAIMASLLSIVIASDDKWLLLLRRRLALFIKSMRPQDRIELYPINYRFP